MNEMWKDIPEFEGYQVSNTGRVRSCRITSSGSLGHTWKELKGGTRGNAKHKNIVPIVSLRPRKERQIYGSKKRCKGYKFKISRLLWQTFNGPIPDKMLIDHIDGNPFNNVLTNLRLATISQNAANKKAANGRKYKGISKSKHGYTALLELNGKVVFRKFFKNEIGAVKAYNEAAIKYFGEYARLNTICDEEARH